MRALQYSAPLIDILQWMLTLEETQRPSFRQLYDKLAELGKGAQGKWAIMNPISIVKAPMEVKEGSKTDIDMRYLQETIAPFFHNDPKQYCTLPARNSPDAAPEASWLPEPQGTVVEDRINPEYWPFKVPQLDQEADPENYRIETTSYFAPLSAVAENPSEEEKHE